MLKGRVFVHILKISIVAFFLTLASVSSANPTRFNFWVHGTYAPEEDGPVVLKSEIAIANLQLEHPCTYVYVGPGFKLSKYVHLDTLLGAMSQNQYMVSPRLMVGYKKFSTFTFAEIYSKEYGGYWFQMMDYQVFPWLKMGAEYESFGSWAKADQISHGVGPHAIFLVGKNIALDAVLQARWDHAAGRFMEEPQFRFNVFL